MKPALYQAILCSFIVISYVAKLIFIRSKLSNLFILGLFCGLICLTLPIFYIYSPNWNNRSIVSPALIFVGGPLWAYTIPLTSFLFDLANRSKMKARSIWPFHIIRCICEIVFITTIWSFAFVYLALILRWIWI